MTSAEFTERMQAISDVLDAGIGDEEGAHLKADGLMCFVLDELGYGEGVDIFRAMPKWYA